MNKIVFLTKILCSIMAQAETIGSAVESRITISTVRIFLRQVQSLLNRFDWLLSDLFGIVGNGTTPFLAVLDPG